MSWHGSPYCRQRAGFCCVSGLYNVLLYSVCYHVTSLHWYTPIPLIASTFSTLASFLCTLAPPTEDVRREETGNNVFFKNETFFSSKLSYEATSISIWSGKLCKYTSHRTIISARRTGIFNHTCGWMEMMSGHNLKGK